MKLIIEVWETTMCGRRFKKLKSFPVKNDRPSVVPKVLAAAFQWRDRAREQGTYSGVFANKSGKYSRLSSSTVEI